MTYEELKLGEYYVDDEGPIQILELTPDSWRIRFLSELLNGIDEGTYKRDHEVHMSIMSKYRLATEYERNELIRHYDDLTYNELEEGVLYVSDDGYYRGLVMCCIESKLYINDMTNIQVRDGSGWIPADSDFKALTFYKWAIEPNTVAKCREYHESLKPKVEEWTPQVGDWVTILQGHGNWNDDMNEYVGKTMQLEDRNEEYFIIKRLNWCWYHNHGHFRQATPEEIQAAQKIDTQEFVLPEKWYVKATVDNRDVLAKWRNGGYSEWGDDLCMTYLSIPYWSTVEDANSDGCTEITFEQFKQYVLKEPVTKEDSLEYLLTEAKRRYPVGTTYWNLNLVGERSEQGIDAKPHTITKENKPYKVEENYNGLGTVISRGKGDGYVYSGGKWAEIVTNEFTPNNPPLLKNSTKEERLAYADKWYTEDRKWYYMGHLGTSDTSDIVTRERNNDTFGNNEVFCGRGYVFINNTWATFVEEEPQLKQSLGEVVKERLLSEPVNAYPMCAECDGNGVIIKDVLDMLGEHDNTKEPCFECNGLGYLEPEPTKTPEELLLEEVKRRYPIGTRFRPAHLRFDKDDTEYCVVVNDRFEFISASIYSLTDEGHTYDVHRYDNKYGNNAYNRSVYHNGKWAEIIALEEPKQWIPTEGEWVVLVSNNCGSENKVGDIGKVYEVDESDDTCEVLVHNGPKLIDGVWSSFTDLRKATTYEIDVEERRIAAEITNSVTINEEVHPLAVKDKELITKPSIMPQLISAVDDLSTAQFKLAATIDKTKQTTEPQPIAPLVRRRKR